MLLRLFVCRLLPFLLLSFYRNKKKLRSALTGICVLYLVCFLTGAWKVFYEEQWWGLLYLPLSMFPHYVCYLFAVWLQVRCIWSAWSERVWKRIYVISMLCIAAGIFLEACVNPWILQIVFGMPG